MKTQKIRIAVAVQPDGNWNAAGWRDANDDQKRECAIGCLEETAGETLVWVEAEVPVPERTETTVQGTLTEAIEAIRKAGGDGWDAIGDPAEYLDRNG